MTTAWLLCLPQADSSFTSAEFSEAFAAFLRLPSPACKSRVGEPVPGRGRLDCWGDSLVNAAMRGDGWRRRHDSVKLCIRGLLRWAGLAFDCEVFNLFAHNIPQAGLARIERGRRRQGLVPDFKLRGVGGEGDILCELKLMSASRSRYPRNPTPRDGRRAVDRRADGLSEEYARKARQVDWEYGGNPRPPPQPRGAPAPPRVIGRVERQLLSFGRVRGWCFGAWGEASTEVHELVQRVAEARLEVADLQPEPQGIPMSRAAQLAGLVGYVRRRLSFCAVQQQARLLLDRLQLLGEGADRAAGRRDRAVLLEAAAARERRAQLVCLRQGTAVMRRGFGMLD